MKTIFELNKTDLENIIQDYFKNKIPHDNLYLNEIKFDLIPSEKRGKREFKCTVIFDDNIEGE